FPQPDVRHRHTSQRSPGRSAQLRAGDLGVRPRIARRGCLSRSRRGAYPTGRRRARLESPAVNLRIPGPTPVPAAVLAAMGHEMINHRGPVFAALIREVTAALKRSFRTSGDVFTFTASGTGALEASVVNTLSPGDPILIVSVGFFGDRYADIAAAYGADVRRLEFPA